MDNNLDIDNFGKEDDIEAALGMRRIAIVGLSSDPMKPSYAVGHYLKAHGYEVIPVNPTEPEVFGLKSYPSLGDLPEPPDVVDVFRRPEHAPEIVDEALAAGAKAVWFQLGVVNYDAARKARQEGLLTVMDRCMKIERSLRNG